MWSLQHRPIKCRIDCVASTCDLVSRMIYILLALVAFGCECFGGPSSSAQSKVNSTMVYVVTSFGARGDGISDDGPAIQKAMTAAAAAGSGQVTFPCGEFFLQSVVGTAPGSRSLLYLKGASRVYLSGQGHCTHLFTRLSQKSVLEFEGSDRVAVANMRISALNAPYVETYGLDGGSAIRFSGVTNGSITHVEVDGASAGALYLTKGTSHSTVANNFIHDTYGGGIWEDDCGGASATTCAPSSPPMYNT